MTNIKVKCLLVDGNWNLKRNFHSLRVEDAYKNRCGGSYGFLISLQAVIRKTLPDKVIIMWDGFQSGRYRYDIYKPYKSNRKGKWLKERDVLSMKIRSQEDQDELDLYMQKMVIKNLLEEFSIRHYEVDYIEGDDLIAGYVLKSEQSDLDEEVIIYSRDKDFRQLVSKKVSLLTPQFETPITIDNFQERVGHVIDNELIFKCFEGDSSDQIEGVKGIKIDGDRNTLEKYIPDIRDRKYTYQEIVDTCNLLREDKKYKKNKTLEKVVNAGEVLYRNARLMNLRKPFLDEDANKAIDHALFGTLDPADRSIDRAMLSLREDGYIRLMRENNIHASDFFAPFYRMINKEKERFNNFQKK